jgi:hypothetical protein
MNNIHIKDQVVSEIQDLNKSHTVKIVHVYHPVSLATASLFANKTDCKYLQHHKTLILRGTAQALLSQAQVTANELYLASVRLKREIEDGSVQYTQVVAKPCKNVLPPFYERHAVLRTRRSLLKTLLSPFQVALKRLHSLFFPSASSMGKSLRPVIKKVSGKSTTNFYQ